MGNRVRLSGEDCAAGHVQPSPRRVDRPDQTQHEYVPLNNIAPKGKRRSRSTTRLLSEQGVLGFEYGYTLADPTDARAVGGAVRRFRQRGAGADRSVSCQRRDQVAAHVRPRACCCRTATRARDRSTPRRGWSATFSSAPSATWWWPTSPRPANYFHALRRQLKRSYRKPLVVMTPKSRCCATSCAISPLADFATGSGHFQPVIIGEVDAIGAERRGGQARRPVQRQGLLRPAGRSGETSERAATWRWCAMEQLYPFPMPGRSSAGAEGDYPHVRDRLVPGGAGATWARGASSTGGIERTLLAGSAEPLRKRPLYVGRGEAASPATGLAQACMRRSRRGLVRQRAWAGLSFNRGIRRSRYVGRDQGAHAGRERDHRRRSRAG